MEEWVERMVVVRRIVGVLHIAEEVVLRIQELGIHIVAVGEVGHNLAVVEDMLVDHIGLPVELENRMGAAEEDMLVDRTVLGVAHHTLAVEGDILEEGIDLEAVDHKPVGQEEVGHTVVEGEDTVHRAVEGNDPEAGERHKEDIRPDTPCLFLLYQFSSVCESASDKRGEKLREEQEGGSKDGKEAFMVGRRTCRRQSVPWSSQAQ